MAASASFIAIHISLVPRTRLYFDWTKRPAGEALPKTFECSNFTIRSEKDTCHATCRSEECYKSHRKSQLEEIRVRGHILHYGKTLRIICEKPAS